MILYGEQALAVLQHSAQATQTFSSATIFPFIVTTELSLIAEHTIIWLTQMQQALHPLRQPLALIPNFSIDGLSPSDPLTQQVISHIDGLEDEEGFTRYGDGYLTGSAWLQRIQLIESVQQQHTPYYIINQFPSVGHAGIQWALASYLMGKEHSAALFISTIQGYGADLRYDEYNIQIGSPKGPMYQTQNVYMRDYSHGLSIVNPSATDSYMDILRLIHGALWT